MTKGDRSENGNSSFWQRFALEKRQQRLLLMVLLALLVTVITVPKGGFVPDYYAPGDIASRDIKAPKDLLVPDPPLTEKKRQRAQDAVPALYDFDSRTAQESGERFQKGMLLLSERVWRDLNEEERQLLRQQVTAQTGMALSEGELTALVALASAPETLAGLQVELKGGLSRRIVGNLMLFQADLEKGVVVRNLADQSEAPLVKPENVTDVPALLARIGDYLIPLKDVATPTRKGVVAVLGKLLRPNLTFNGNETEARRQLARESVKPVLFQVKKGEMIVREGERVSEEQIKKLRALRDVGSDISTFRVAAGLFLTTILLLLVVQRFAVRNIRKYHLDNRDLLFLALAVLGQFFLIKVAIFVANALESALPYVDSASYYYLFPFAVGAMLVRIVLNAEVALVYTLLVSLLLGILFGNNLLIVLFLFADSLTGAHWVRHCNERATLYRAGLRIALLNLLLIPGIHLLAGHLFDWQLLYKMAFGVGSGFLCAVIVTGTIPLVESLFKYTTDIKLLELANMNTPALRELMIQAPGTYHHSIVVGNMVEAAAENINANPLLARVAAYYHDIGKAKKPLYFIENTKGLENRHDKLTPSMSALILMAHVKDGVEMAKENKLGQKLVDIIRQHHGTALMKFFYEKAKSKEDPGVHSVDERAYRYPGPKPQTREAALIMLADAVEAASRTLTDPTPARIQGMVQKIINNIFIDGQLDECELTLKDLHNIAKSFNRVLAGIFHHRVDYPEPAYRDREKEAAAKRKQSEDIHREPAKETKDRETSDAEGGAEDLKRLGIS